MLRLFYRLLPAEVKARLPIGVLINYDSMPREDLRVEPIFCLVGNDLAIVKAHPSLQEDAQ